MKLTYLAVLALLPLAACSSNPPPPPPAPAMPAASAQDQNFVAMAAQSDMFEVQSSQLALQKSHNRRYREFAQHMIDDHTKTTQQLTSLAGQKNIALPTSLSSELQEELTALGAAGNAFDRKYRADQISGHETAAKNLQDEISNGTDPDLKAFAQNTLPTVQEHLKLAQRLSGGAMTHTHHHHQPA